ncbi:MAG TPA: condensation domain-containing protein, partial [Thermoanaerobaculia bacterium]|nr:condensation domain-containing protein [Thermoanaerobaculia bacterium]
MSIEGGKTFKLTSKRLELLQALRREQGLVPASGERIPRQPARETYPLSFNQQRLWLLDQLQPESAAYVLNQAMHLRGRLSLPALARSLTEVVCRHSVLRTVFEAVDGEPVQRIAVPAAVPLPVIDGSALAPAAREGWLKEVSNREARRPFDLSQGARGPLLRAHLLRLGAEEHVLLASVHHIATDGWSQGLLMRELAALYGAFARALPSPLPELPIQYADFACWQRGWLTDEVLEQQLAYWNETLSGAALLMLPTDRPRPPLETFRGASTIFMLDVETSAALRRLAQRQGSTLFMTLLAAFAALLCRYSGQAEVSIGSPTANRIRVELEGLIGFFVNTLVLRIDAAADPELGELLERVRRTVVGAFAHQDLPFERIVAELQPARDLSRSPLFQVMFILQNAQTIGGAAPVVEGLAMEPMGTTAGVARFDLTLSMTDAPEGIGGGLEYNVDLFDRTTIERLAGHLQTLLGAAALTAAPGSPSARLSELPLLSPAERHQLSVEWLDTRRAGPGETRVDLWIERQALARPEAAALCWVGGRMSYGELLAEAGRMARRLRARGLRPGEPVGVAVERSARLVPALLGIWQAGGAYLPMDPSYPEERLLYML